MMVRYALRLLRGLLVKVMQRQERDGMIAIIRASKGLLFRMQVFETVIEHRWDMVHGEIQRQLLRENCDAMFGAVAELVRNQEIPQPLLYQFTEKFCADKELCQLVQVWLDDNVDRTETLLSLKGSVPDNMRDWIMGVTHRHGSTEAE